MKTIFFFLALAIYVAQAQPTAPLESRAERATNLQSALPSNSFLSGPTGIETANTMVALQDKIIENGGCNLNICFGLDGSNLISNRDYEFQREFVQLVAATITIDERIKLSAYQYGLRLQRISKFTANANQFLLSLESAERQDAQDRSFLAPAIFQCQRDFRDNPEDANKIVLIGDGRTNYGRRSQAVRIAEQFLPPNNNGAICAVYVRRPASRFLERITQNRDRVLDVEDYFFFADILDEVVSNVCDLV